MRVAGVLLSGLGHAALVALALHGPPWLGPHREGAPPVIAVSFATEAELAALARPAPPPAPPAEPRAAEPPAAKTPVAVSPSTVEPEPPAEAPADSLAPAFDPEAPLGIARDAGATPVTPADRPRPRAAPAAEGEPLLPWSGEARELRRRYEEEVRAAVGRAATYPQVARDRGLEGSARLHLVVLREGRLLTAQLVRSSGAQTLDRAALAAARDATLPAAPDELANERFSLEVELVFTDSDG